MEHRWLIAAAGLALAFTRGAGAAGLTDTEWQWLRGAEPVLQYAETVQLPVDVVVQPQDAPGLPPLAMAFKDGRCKLVLSMRGNPAAAEALGSVPADLTQAVLEVMAAHELGHCWRHVRGAWAGLPAGFSEPPPVAGEDARTTALRRGLQETRREEGFSDLVGLVWARTRHPAAYERVRTWLEKERAGADVPLSHDTRPWLDLVRIGTALDGEGSIFERAQGVWKQGLRAVD